MQNYDTRPEKTMHFHMRMTAETRKALDMLSEKHKISASAVIDMLIAREVKEKGVAKIIKCKDCIYSRDLCRAEKELYNEKNICCTKMSTFYHSVVMEENGFCSFGKPKGEDK